MRRFLSIILCRFRRSNDLQRRRTLCYVVKVELKKLCCFERCSERRNHETFVYVYTGWSTQRVHRYIFQNMHCTKKCYIQKLHGFKGYTLSCINFFYRWRRFGDLKVNFVFLNRILYFLYQNMVEHRIASKIILTFTTPKPNS